MRVVVALGGSALLRPGEPADVATQRRNLSRAVRALAGLARDHELVVTHGSGPQVGLLALQSDAYRQVDAYPLDVLSAETEGMIGYLLDQELASELPGRRVATLLTQVVVDPADPAFALPSKPIGPWHDEVTAAMLERRRGWTFVRSGGACRRVVPCPEPIRIVELDTIRLLIDAGVITVCAGGGGIAVVEDDDALRGVEAVVEKDLAAALLARDMDADALLLLTDVAAVEAGRGRPGARPLDRTTPGELRALGLPAGSMGPKAEAAARFVEATGGIAAIAALDDAAAALAGTAGTQVAVPALTGSQQARTEQNS
jgi:carbamate kinase